MTRSTGKGFWIAATFLFAFGVARVVTMASMQSEDIMGGPAPALEIPSVHGENVSLEALKGKVILIDFWAVWCGPCKKSAPFFQELADKYGDDGLEVIGVHVDDRMPPADKVAEYLDDAGVSYVNALSNVDVDNGYMIYAMPTTYLIDREGILVKRHIGFNPDTAPAELEEAVRGLLGLD